MDFELIFATPASCNVVLRLVRRQSCRLGDRGCYRKTRASLWLVSISVYSRHQDALINRSPTHFPFIGGSPTLFSDSLHQSREPQNKKRPSMRHLSVGSLSSSEQICIQLYFYRRRVGSYICLINMLKCSVESAFDFCHGGVILFWFPGIWLITEACSTHAECEDMITLLASPITCTSSLTLIGHKSAPISACQYCQSTMVKYAPDFQ